MVNLFYDEFLVWEIYVAVVFPLSTSLGASGTSNERTGTSWTLAPDYARLVAIHGRPCVPNVFSPPDTLKINTR